MSPDVTIPCTAKRDRSSLGPAADDSVARLTKKEFVDRLRTAARGARALASQYVVESLPETIVFNLRVVDDPRGTRGPEGTVKFLGGRFVLPANLVGLDASQAASLLWVDGRVPRWVNLYVEECDDQTTTIALMLTARLVEADAAKLPRDIGASPENELAPFRIRGHGLPAGWRSVATDGRVSIRKRPSTGHSG
jgi:hypothetical protein